VGLGFNRSDHEEPCVAGAVGSGNVRQYPEPLRTLYNNKETCPENLLLWFHHVAWSHTMQNGLSLWDNLCYTYDRGVRQAGDFLKTWESLRPVCCGGEAPLMDAERYEQQRWRFERQAKDAQWWRDACLLYFQQFSRQPLPHDCPPFRYSLEQVMNYRLDMDNYTAADPAKLP